MHRISRKLSFLFIILLLIVSSFFTLGNVRAKSAGFTEVKEGIWSDGTSKYYLRNGSLLSRSGGETTVLQSFSLKSWETMKLINAAEGNLYLERQDDTGCSELYLYQIKSKRYQRISEKFHAAAVSGLYFAALSYEPTDVSACPMTLYKATPSGIQRVRLLSSFSIDQVILKNGRFWYPSYQSPDLSGVLKIRSIRTDGTGMKTLCQISAPKNSIAEIRSIKGNLITIEVSRMDGNGKSITYHYNTSSNQLSLG